MNPYVIIGSSASGLSVAATLRSLDPGIEIICISDELEAPYNKCRLMDYISDKITIERVFTNSLDWFEKQRIAIRLGQKIIAIDRIGKQIFFANGKPLAYHKLFLGVGSTNISLNIAENEKKKNVFEVRSLADIHALQKFIALFDKPRVAIVGCGLTGLELADALYARADKLFLIDSANYPLKQYVSSGAADFIMKHLKKERLEFYFNNTIKQFQLKNNLIKAIILSEGIVLPVDLVAVTIGTHPATDLALKAGLICNENGIIVNKYFQTNDKNIYAGGDAACIYHAVIKKYVRSTKWSDAVMHGVHAARAMLDAQIPYPGLCSSISSRFFDMHWVSSGFLYNLDQFEIIEISNTQSYRMLALEHGVIRRFCVINDEFFFTQIRKSFSQGISIDTSQLKVI